MGTTTRRAPHDVRRPRDVLSLKTWRGQNCSNLAGDEQSDNSSEVDEVQLFEAALIAARNVWDIRRRRGGMFSIGRIHKADADKHIKAALAAMAEGGGE